MLIFSSLAYGGVEPWAWAAINLGVIFILICWGWEAWRTQRLRLNLSPLQLPLLGIIAVGLIQLLPFNSAASNDVALLGGAVHSLSFDPYSTRLTLLRVLGLLIYFAAALSFLDNSRRLRLIVRTITIFGAILACIGMFQSFLSPEKIYGIVPVGDAFPFGPYINRHHFAAFMEMALALPLGLLFAGAVERQYRPFYVLAVSLMGIALLMTGSRGAFLGFIAETVFLFLFALNKARLPAREMREPNEHRPFLSNSASRLASFIALLAIICAGAIFFGRETALQRVAGTLNAADPSSGRLAIWRATLHLIRDHPFIGVGIGAFETAFPRFDSQNGLYGINQTHNDYLQIVAEAGILGGALGLFFIVALFREGFARMKSGDKFRRAVATSALAGCTAALVHSFFDFFLHTTSNSLLFLILATLATVKLSRIIEPHERSNSESNLQQRTVTVAAELSSHACAKKKILR